MGDKVMDARCLGLIVSYLFDVEFKGAALQVEEEVYRAEDKDLITSVEKRCVEEGAMQSHQGKTGLSCRRHGIGVACKSPRLVF